MRLLEVVRGDRTAKPVVATAMQLARRIGKIGVLVGVCYGFVGNRMLAPRQREANKLILEGAMPWDVDRPHRFRISDGALRHGRPCRARYRLVAGNIQGRDGPRDPLRARPARPEDGGGFYDYDENRNAKPSKDVEQVILDLSSRHGIARRAIPDEEILERCIYTMINEGAKILEEGKAQRASDIDIVWINGYGWPVYRGGPMFHGDQPGLRHVRDRLEHYEAQRGPDFKPAALLERLVAEGKSFRDL